VAWISRKVPLECHRLFSLNTLRYPVSLGSRFGLYFNFRLHPGRHHAFSIRGRGGNLGAGDLLLMRVLQLLAVVNFKRLSLNNTFLVAVQLVLYLRLLPAINLAFCFPHLLLSQ
jgi:hypothetical protein